MGVWGEALRKLRPILAPLGLPLLSPFGGYGNLQHWPDSVFPMIQLRYVLVAGEAGDCTVHLSHILRSSAPPNMRVTDRRQIVRADYLDRDWFNVYNVA